METYAKLLQFNSLAKMLEELPDDKRCREYLEAVRWDGEPQCPCCGKRGGYILRIKGEFNGMYKCKDKMCNKRFTVTMGTVFEGTHVGLRKWFIAMYIFATHKKGVSSHQLAADLGITQKSAWYLLHRIRRIMTEDNNEMLEGVVQLDETFVGGKNKNRHVDKKVPHSTGRAFLDKTPLFGMLSIKDDVKKVRCFVVPDTKAKSIQPLILENIKRDSTLYSDEWWAYNGLYRVYNHGIVDHGKKQYKNGDVCTNDIEGFWSHFKRGIIGIYHKVSRKHLQRYAYEFAYRYNMRKASVQEMFRYSLLNTNNTRLYYKELIGAL